MNELESIIRQEILSSGSISFARFMELALYCPKIGYYERGAPSIGRKGDFYTAVSTGPLFGELLARQYIEWLNELGSGANAIVECGAHDGQLAFDILSWATGFEPKASLQYTIIEPSERRRALQQARLDIFAGQVSWFASLEGLPHPISGVIFSNELLDAMPVHLLQWQRGHWVELRVVLQDDGFGFEAAELEADLGQPNIPPALAVVLPEGYQIEVSPIARQWWQTAAARLASGKLLAIDYGSTDNDLLSPRRIEGTVRAYRQHRISTDLLARAGEQDITAHVNFTAIRRAGELAGLRTDALITQSKFLSEIAAKIRHWPHDRVRQFQTLTHPEHMGRAFHVLIQSR